MRLLNVDTKELEEYDAYPRPKYAILSHTWGENEVTFQDIHQSHALSMTGYEKIEYLCDQARKDDLQYAWIDTCCIDKTSSAELSEAINSMFEWYKDAHVCYAYLTDVDLEGFDSKFRKSRWFKRGWTLQELLAPERIVFYGKGWIHLGDKHGLVSIISSRTGIPELALRRPPTIHTFSIAARMFWARERQTRRVEDIAYCLLGIFKVNMPLLYGEGSKAFKRLQEELIKASDDESLFACNILSSSGTVLAHDPSAFSKGKDIVPIQQSLIPQPYSMTNKGLHIHLRLLDEGREDYFLGILNCQISNDFSGYIAIPLKATKIPDTFTRRPNSSSKLWRRISEEEYTKADSRTIYIRQNESQSFTSTCWLRSNSVRHHGYLLKPNFYHFFNSWDEKTQMSKIHHDWFHHVRCYTFIEPDFGYAFSALFYVNAFKETAGVVLYVKPESKGFEDWQQSLSWGPLEVLVDEWETNGLPMSASIILNESSTFGNNVYEIEALVSQSKKLRQDVWVLDITVKRVNDEVG